MENKDEVHSDSDGSYELVNINDYASDNENMEAATTSNMALSDDGSYDFLCSEVSDTLVLTEEEAFNNTSVSEDDSFAEFCNFLSESATKDMETINSDPKMENEEDDVEMVPEIASDIDFTDKKGKKRNLMTMICDNPNFDVLDFPAKLKLKEDIKEVAKNHIIRYLPAKTLAKTQLVSKEWNQWIKSPFFAHIQSQHFKKTSGFFKNETETVRFVSLNHSAYGVPDPSLKFLPYSVTIRNSCNGLLLCQAIIGGSGFFVCNPANRNWCRIPPSHYYHGVNPKVVLAFEPNSLNFMPCYQIICPFSLPDHVAGPIVYFDIYDSNTKSWRVSEMVCVDLHQSEVKSDGIFVNGIVYWETTGGEMLAFDLKNEIYSVQTMPFSENGALSNVYGEICYVKATYIHLLKSCFLDVYGGGIMSLKHTFEILVFGVEDGEFVECTVLGNSGEDVIAVIIEKSGGQKRLYAYNVKEEKVEKSFIIWGSNKLFPYVNSLVSIAG